MATAISMYYMSQQIGIAVGISISSSFLKQQFQATLQKTLVDVPGCREVGPFHNIFKIKKTPDSLANRLSKAYWLTPLWSPYSPSKFDHWCGRVICTVSGLYQVCSLIFIYLQDNSWFTTNSLGSFGSNACYATHVFNYGELFELLIVVRILFVRSNLEIGYVFWELDLNPVGKVAFGTVTSNTKLVLQKKNGRQYIP